MLRPNSILKFLIIFFIISCGTIKEPDSIFIGKIERFKNGDLSKLNFEGAYHFNIEPRYQLDHPIYFFKNGLVYYDGISTKDIAFYESWMRKNSFPNKTWGVYEIVGDTLKVSVYSVYYDNTAHYLQTNFQGIIKNRDIILDWRVIEPYPKLNKVLTKSYDSLFKWHNNLYFKPLAIKSFMDSASEKAWVNKYRKDK